MRKAHEYFLVLAKTLHFTRAANQLYISQQALSDQIQHLEAELHTKLFIRKPKLALTPAGELLEQTLYNICRLEKNFHAQLTELDKVDVGTIQIGMHTGRANILFPRILDLFYQRYPQVSIHTISDQTRNYKQLLDEGKIDFFFGINAPYHAELASDIITDEPMCLVIHTKALQRLFPGCPPEKLEALRQGADLEQFVEVPFIFASEISQGQSAINQYLARKNLHLHVSLVLNDYTIQYRLLSTMPGACFCYKMLAPTILQYSRSLPLGEALHVFPLKDFCEPLKLSLVRYCGAFFPPFTQYLYDLIRREVTQLVQ